MKKLLTPILALSVLLATPFFAQAKEAANELPPVFDQFKAKGEVKLVKAFDTPFGLKGYSVTNNGIPTVVYTDKTGKFLVLGVVLDKDGKNYTQDYIDQYATSAAYKDGIKGLAKDAAWVEEGTGPQTIYVFYEPNCHYCAKFYELTRNHLADLKIRWIPVAFLAAASTDEAAAILASKDPSKMISDLHDAKANKTSAPIPEGITAEHRARVAANASIMRQFGLQGTPAIVYEREGKMATVRGMPTPEQFSAILGKQITMQKVAPQAK